MPPSFATALDDAATAAAGPAGSERSVRCVRHEDRVDLRAHRPAGSTLDDRALLHSAGAALLDARVAVAASGWAAEVDRLAAPDDPDLLAVLRPVDGPPDPALAALALPAPECADAPDCDRGRLPPGLIRRLGVAARDEETDLLLVRGGSAPLLERLGRMSGAADRAGLRGLLLSTRDDDAYAWLRTGEAQQRLSRQLARQGWTAEPVAALTGASPARAELRAELTWERHPQALLLLRPTGQEP